MTERRLFQAFDLQRIDGNARLQAVIDAAHRRIKERELSDDELDLVAAAGITPAPKKPGEERT
ncbi:MAG: hypothetical protein IKN38_00110 [Clostridia bacterium]|nr:hypothetical protein [Clostridia bacterium]